MRQRLARQKKRYFNNGDLLFVGNTTHRKRVAHVIVVRVTEAAAADTFVTLAVTVDAAVVSKSLRIGLILWVNG